VAENDGITTMGIYGNSTLGPFPQLTKKPASRYQRHRNLTKKVDDTDMMFSSQVY